MRMQSAGFRIGGPLTPAVKTLMIANGAVFLIQQLAGLFWPNAVEGFFGLHYAGLIEEFKLWQVFTYMFLHGGWFHILFNLLALWMFAGDLELRWGRGLFLRYYLFSGIGAGIFITVMNFFLYTRYQADPVTIGASGAIYALLLAYGLTWPNREVLLYFLFPIKMKYLVLAFGLMEFFGSLSTASGAGGNISHIGHLGGLFSGFLFLMYQRKNIAASSPSRQKKEEGPLSRLFKTLRLRKKRREINRRIEAKKIIDGLLEKIARDGMSSLTAQERRDLEWARKRYYPDDSETIH